MSHTLHIVLFVLVAGATACAIATEPDSNDGPHDAAAVTELDDGALLAGEEPDDDDCLIISEYIEGSGSYNKAIELFNCGDTPVDLSRVAVCLVRNELTSCTATAPLDASALAAGDVVTLCRNKTGRFDDPVAQLRDACELELPGVMSFNGDDRLIIFRDDNADGFFDAAVDPVLDSLGRFDWHPLDMPWADKTLRRCDFTPADGVSLYDHTDYFAEYARNDASNLGQPPTPECI